MADALLSLSLNDLRLLALLLQEGSITRVAEASGQAQPAVSRKLQRLREVLADPLLVRSGGRMMVTERARALQAPLREILGQVARLEGAARFDPAAAERAFQIVTADCLPPGFLPAVIQRLIGAGPRISALLKPPGANVDVGQALDEGTVDLVISNDPRPREDLRTAPLYEDEVVCMMRRGHPFEQDRRYPLARWLRLAHLAPAVSAAPRTGPIDGELAKTGYQRRIAATVPEFHLVPHVLLATDLVFTTARRFAEHYAATMPIAVVRAPSEIPPMRFYQLWHDRNHTSAASRWLRQQVAEVAAGLGG